MEKAIPKVGISLTDQDINDMAIRHFAETQVNISLLHKIGFNYYLIYKKCMELLNCNIIHLIELL